MNYVVYDIDVEPNADWAKDVVMEHLGEFGFECFEALTDDDALKGYIPLEKETSVLPFANANDFLELALPVAVRFRLKNKQVIEDRNWNTEWEKTPFPTIEINDKFVVHDARTQLEAQHDAMIDIPITVAQSFGSGTHATTTMMMRMMADLEGVDAFFKAKKVLDVGTGTGILAIAAAKMNASVVALDIDEWSYKNARQNAALNKVKIDIRLGDIQVVSKEEKYDVILANINRNVLLDSMLLFKERIGDGGTLLLSGFLDQDIDVLIEKATNNGFIFKEKQAEGDWRSLRFLYSDTRI